MSVPLAFLAVIVVWSTTPLGVKWSSEGIAPVAGAFFRILLAAMVAVLVCRLMKLRIPWHRDALRLYASSTLGWFVGLSCVYQAASQLSSGLISVLFGLSPIVSGLLGRWLLAEPPFKPVQWVAMLLGVAGLLVVFRGEVSADTRLLSSLSLVMVAMLCFCLSGILVKRFDLGVHPLSQATGSLLVSLPLYGLAVVVAGEPLLVPEQITERAVAAIVYLALFGSLLGFLCYFYVLRRLSPSTVALSTLVTPVLALALGALINKEIVTEALLMGAALIVLALVLHIYGTRWVSGPRASGLR